MDEAEFDRFADEYRATHAASIGASGEEPEFFHKYKVDALADRVKSSGCPAESILDFGSGIGNSIPHFLASFPGASLTCADVSRRSLDVASSRFPGSSTFLKLDPASGGLPAGRYDVIFSACVFHHIDPVERVAWFARLRDSAKPGALLAVFEHNPWNPLTVHAVNSCPFDENAQLLSAPRLIDLVAAAGWSHSRAAYHLFFPRALRSLRVLERYLSGIPLGAQYVVYARA
jgi:SAM-dependent methyltransferase